MANNWGHAVGVIALSRATELHINRDAEMDGKKFLVLSKFVKSESYSGPAKGGSLLIPMEKLGELRQAIDKAHGGASQ
jgi:hypothetical protein